MSVLRIEDDRRRVLTFGAAPRRIVSLVPSDTLNVVALGAAEALVGRTDYCDTPADVVGALPSVGGTKNPNLEAVAKLEPDLVLANQEENTKGDLEALAQRGIRVLVAFPKRVASGLSHLARLAQILRVERDPKVVCLLRQGYRAMGEAERRKSRVVRVFCPIWMDPLMTIHQDTFISDMLHLVGAENVFADRRRAYPLKADLGLRAPASSEVTAGRDTRYPRVTMEEVRQREPELVLLPDEPHPFSDADAQVFARELASLASPPLVRHVGGKDLCWAGARSVEGIGRLVALMGDIRNAL